MNNDALLRALDKLQPPMPEGKEHLVYRDFPKMKLELFEWFLEKLAPWELEVLTFARYETPNGVLARGQIFVHPDGLAELSGHLERDIDDLIARGIIKGKSEGE